ncbi:ATP-binding cassette domain-containing protein [Leucobacter luti]|uniref:ABC-2 type transport system ATP-binding protein n=1 Tax=Leucobacter luti TaxID=340320 RepID=A0A4V6MD33_9MICO|nr:ATP-binding cassette domain-containing protein [Leucobacter luti]MBL3699171.1 ATP-binding cassette domain-containing protein [Leucobacter luti]RZT66669.1 ABC-2 type transport system ATP-binding protein [Leucobacter luti]
MQHTVRVEGLTKKYGTVRAVSALSFTAEPGRVTGFLGPNGSGKTTTLAMVLGLARPDSGSATIGGVPYTALERPALTVGASLSADFHPAHTGRAHLDIARRAIGVPAARVDEIFELVGLSDAADRKTGGYSLGMRQRLALGTALLGDPDVVLLDEPINGLDPEGIRWIRVLLRHLASTGKTVLLSSHLLSEVQQTVDDVVVIRRGELAFAGPLAELQRGTGEHTVLVSAPDQPGLAAALEAAQATVHGQHSGALRVTGADPAAVGRIALAAGIPLTHLSVETGELEQSFLDLIDGTGQHSSAAQAAAQTQHAPTGGPAPDPTAAPSEGDHA